MSGQRLDAALRAACYQQSNTSPSSFGRGAGEGRAHVERQPRRHEFFLSRQASKEIVSAALIT
ncbi:hypothetical protein XAP412_770034 [Xanthomonas phaseoli pv. phaseoli]|uniref:Secreted protein n=1 Tax=Xanthomonas campestris pv. phaseoli TaxID=317013 RepID=A0AB38E501_XANCH|nr:hypothetical protein XAP6984_810034 [Xanthomonas phaseoli pv. phaseoli]SON90230.1 hypothetical protein XAP412_770034 [Xanthomonas phaseoli pv. phaseoli]SON92477.1 hypothetical protein XAP7430_770035 [Xanthomonas phaseoli pv. phaseoli]SOO29383.1 hypothetical protein XAP6164_3300003 [Xanthomonas phaseoli pv. phaseoli]